VIDAARWATTDDRARVVVSAAFQQRLVGRADVDEVLSRLRRVRRRELITMTVADAQDGSHSLAELDFVRLCRSHGLPVPSRQVARTDMRGTRRYLDALFEPWQVQVEIDGSHHLEAGQWWADLRRQNDLWVAGLRLLRYPAWVIRERPGEVATQLRAALIAAGWQPPTPTPSSTRQPAPGRRPVPGPRPAPERMARDGRAGRRPGQIRGRTDRAAPASDSTPNRAARRIGG
jgi:hypothetical protein